MPPRPFLLLTIPLVMVGIFAGASAATDGDAPAMTTLSLRQAEQTALRNQPTHAPGARPLRGGRGPGRRGARRLPPAGHAERHVRAHDGKLRQHAGEGPPGRRPERRRRHGGSSAINWNPQHNLFQLNAGASQLIYDFGQTSNRIASAGASRDAAGANTRTATLQTLLNVRRAYFTARANRDLVAVAEETVRNQDKHVEQTQAFVRTGIQPDINLATVQTALANAKVQLVQARNNYAVAEAQLSQAMGVSVSEHYVLSDEQVSPIAGEDGDPAPLVATAEKNRPGDRQPRPSEDGPGGDGPVVQGGLRAEPERPRQHLRRSARPSRR